MTCLLLILLLLLQSGMLRRLHELAHQRLVLILDLLDTGRYLLSGLQELLLTVLLDQSGAMHGEYLRHHRSDCLNGCLVGHVLLWHLWLHALQHHCRHCHNVTLLHHLRHLQLHLLL